MIHLDDGTGWQLWREFDANGKLVHFKDNEGKEKWY